MEDELRADEAAEGVSAEEAQQVASTEEREQAEQTQEVSSQTDIETRFEALQREIAERDARISKELERATQSIKDSNVSVAKKVHEQLKPIQAYNQKLVAAGTLTAEEAEKNLLSEKLRLEQAELDRPAPIPKKEEVEPPDSMRRAIARINKTSGLAPSDEEWAQLPKEWLDEDGLPTNDPIAAIEGYRVKAAELVGKKNARLNAAKQRKQEAVSATVPTIEPSGGNSSVVSDSTDALVDKIRDLMKNTPRDPSLRAKAKKEIEDLEARLAKAMSK